MLKSLSGALGMAQRSELTLQVPSVLVFRILSVPHSIHINLTTHVIIARAHAADPDAHVRVIRMHAPRVCTLVLFIVHVRPGDLSYLNFLVQY